MATVMSACTAFLLASLLPLTAWLLLQDEPTHALIAALVLLFTAAMWMTVRSANTAINHALRLRLENADRIAVGRVIEGNDAEVRQDEWHPFVAADYDSIRSTLLSLRGKRVSRRRHWSRSVTASLLRTCRVR